MAQGALSSLTLGKQGRIVVPAEMRKALDLKAGDELVASVEDRRLVIESRASLVERVRARFRDIDGSLAEELLAERRQEALRE